MKTPLLNQYEKPTGTHYRIFGLSWAGWGFDFYDLILFTFLIIPIGLELHLSTLMLSYALKCINYTAAIGGVVFGVYPTNMAENQPLIFVFMFIVGIGTGIYGGYGPIVSELFPTEIKNTAMGSGFNIARGTQFITPILIAE